MSEVHKSILESILAARVQAEIRQNTAKTAGDSVKTTEVIDLGNEIKVVADEKGIRVVRSIKPTRNNTLSQKQEKPVDFWNDLVKKNI